MLWPFQTSTTTLTLVVFLRRLSLQYLGLQNFLQIAPKPSPMFLIFGLYFRPSELHGQQTVGLIYLSFIMLCKRDARRASVYASLVAFQSLTCQSLPIVGPGEVITVEFHRAHVVAPQGSTQGSLLRLKQPLLTLKQIALRTLPLVRQVLKLLPIGMQAQEEPDAEATDQKQSLMLFCTVTLVVLSPRTSHSRH